MHAGAGSRRAVHERTNERRNPGGGGGQYVDAPGGKGKKEGKKERRKERRKEGEEEKERKVQGRSHTSYNIYIGTHVLRTRKDIYYYYLLKEERKKRKEKRERQSVPIPSRSARTASTYLDGIGNPHERVGGGVGWCLVFPSLCAASPGSRQAGSGQVHLTPLARLVPGASAGGWVGWSSRIRHATAPMAAPIAR